MVYDPGPIALLRAGCHPVEPRWHSADCVVCTEKRHNPHHGKDGKFSSGSGGGTPEDMHSRAALDATYGYHDHATGLTASVTSVSGGDPGRSTYVTISVKDRKGNEVGQGTRTIQAASRKTVAHSGFTLAEGMQGQGFMTRYNQHVEGSYRAHGIERIEIHASGGLAGGRQVVGSYAWARAGYNFSGPMARESVARAALAHKGASPHVRAEIERVAANPHSTPAEFAMIGHTPGAKMWPGKEILLGHGPGWDGVKTL